MKVILKENVESLGKLGDVINVSVGYARNYLIPKGLAIEASSKNVNALKHEQSLISKRAEKEKTKAESLRAKLENITCVIQRKVGEQEKLFGSITSKDIEKALIDQGIEVDRKSIHLEEPIKNLGKFSVMVKLYPGVSIEVTVIVEAEA
jgi:large subunit ribosomal protein L9